MRTISTIPIIKATHEVLANQLIDKFDGKGMVFGTIHFRKPMKMRKFHRTEKGDDGKKLNNPYVDNVFEVGTLQVEFNGDWQNKVDNVRDRENGVETEWVADKKRPNGIENYKDSKVVCINSINNTFYLNYIVMKYVDSTIYVNKDNNILDYDNIKEYHQVKTTQNKLNEAMKHGLTTSTDPQIRQIKIENIESLRIFGVEYRPILNQQWIKILDIPVDKAVESLRA